MEQLALETNVLAAIIKGKIGVDLIFNVDVTAFAHKSTRFVYQTILDFLNQYGTVPNSDGFGEKVDSSGFSDAEKIKLKALIDKIFNLDDGPSRPMFYWEEFRKSLVRRKTKISAEKMLQTIDTDPFGARQGLLDDLMKIEGAGARVKRQSFTEAFDDRHQDVLRQRQARDDQTFIPLGVLNGKLDEELGGGMRLGELFMWLAHPGGGKSIAMEESCGNAVTLGIPSAYFTLEMPMMQTALRIDSSISGVRYRRLRQGNISEEEYQDWKAKVDGLRGKHLYVVELDAGSNTRLIESEIRKLPIQPKKIFVDWLGQMSPNDGSYSHSLDWGSITSCARDLKSLARRLNIVVETASQLDPESVEKDIITFRDYGFSKVGLQAQIDVGVAIIQTPSMKSLGITRIQFTKVRDGFEESYFQTRTNYDYISLGEGE